MGNIYQGKETIWSQDYNSHTQGPLQASGKGKDEEGDGGADKPLMCVDAYCVDVYLVAETWVMR